MVTIVFVIKFSKSTGQLGHCCKPEKLQQLILLLQVGLAFLNKCQFTKKNCNHSGNHSLKLFCIAFFIKFSNNELAVIDHPKCSNLQQPLYSLLFHCLLHTATPSSITNYHLVLQPKHLSCNVRLRGSKRHDKLEFWPQILRSYIDDKHSGWGRFFQQLWAQEMMQIVQDVTSAEFSRLLGKKLVLSRPY